MSKNKPMLIGNWSDEDREMYCGGSFAKGQHDDLAVKEWQEMSAAMPNIHRTVTKQTGDDAPGYRGQTGQRQGLLRDIAVPDENTPVGGSGEFNNRVVSDHLRSKQRKELHDGKRVIDGRRNTMPRGTWHRSQTWKDEKSLSDKLLGRQVLEGTRVSQAQTVCSIDGKPLPAGQRMYCSAECKRIGSNAGRRKKDATRRNNRVRAKPLPQKSLPRDERGWYQQTPASPSPRNPNVHPHWAWEAQVPHTVSRDYRLRRPWAEEPKVWKIQAA